eukprot:TRINITY_DN16437_c0_g1_i1.p1 TRINITY_DN16437_c0_g1~~TRINITY_DN16437_c0_g1_i1.p1  ORF type:complete len:134 (-),score=29.31 TRINITY_DN16437_c0_g1_i1:13-378(-)
MCIRDRILASIMEDKIPPQKAGVFLPKSQQQNLAKEVLSTPYALTGETARDSFRKVLYDAFLAIMKEETSKYPISDWVNKFEENLHNLSGNVISKEYREKTNLLLKAIKVKQAQLLSLIHI